MRAYRDDEWARVRERGRWAYVMRHGLLSRGLPLGLITAVVLEVYLGDKLPGAFLSLAFLGRLFLAVGVFTLSGAVSANANWIVHERHYQRKG